MKKKLQIKLQKFIIIIIYDQYMQQQCDFEIQKKYVNILNAILIYYQNCFNFIFNSFMNINQIQIVQKKNYPHYRNLSSKIKKQRIEQAYQSPQFKKPNPQNGLLYPEQNFLEFNVKDKNILKLYTYRYVLSNQVIGVIYIFNGINFCTHHSAHIAKAFAQKGYAVVGFDYRGFGKSEGEPGSIDSMQILISDSLQFIREVDKIYTDKPKFAIGLSLGGLILYHISLKDEHLFSGVILISALIKPMVGSFICTIANTISKLLPKVRIFSFQKGIISKNETVANDLSNDSFYYKGKIPAKTYKILLNQINECYKTFNKYKANFLVIQGGLDKIVHPDGAFELYDNCVSADKQIIFYENMWHDAFHEEEIFDIIPKIIKWIDNHIEK